MPESTWFSKEKERVKSEDVTKLPESWSGSTPRYFRPTEVDHLLGNAEKANKLLDWKPLITVDELCREMVEADLYRARQELARREGGSATAEEWIHQDGRAIEKR